MLGSINTFFHKHPYVLGIVLFLLGGATAIGIVYLRNAPSFDSIMVIRDYQTKKYHLIRPPVLPYENGAIADKAVPALKDEITKYIVTEEKNGDLTNAAVYFRDLNNGPWFGINSGKSFIPASLLKVPLMLGLFKAAEQHPEILEQKIKFNTPSTDVSAQIKNGTMLVLGQTYTVDELIRRMIVDSDNNAADLLSQYMSEDEIYDVYHDLGLNLPSPDVMYKISAKDYATFFRVLYNASYLSRDSSEKALGLLLETTFDKGLSAGLPANTQIADKFGEREFMNSSLHQLHDCGIVYVPKKPYLICVMTIGTDSSNLERIMAAISQFTYNSVLRN